MPYTPQPAGAEAGQALLERVRASHESALMAIEGVRGVGVGRTPIGDSAIVVYLRDDSVRQRVPRQVGGYPVETVVTGEIDAYRAPGAAHRP